MPLTYLLTYSVIVVCNYPGGSYVAAATWRESTC